MAEVLHGLELLSFGSTQAWNASGGGSGEPDDKVVATILRREEPPHIAYRRRFNNAFSEHSREVVYKEAAAELKSWRKRETPADAKAWVSLDDLILKSDIGLSPEVIAARRGLDPNHVRRLRKKNNKGSEDGLTTVPGSEEGDRVDAAAILKDQGFSQAEIARRLETSQPTVSRLLERAKFRRAA